MHLDGPHDETDDIEQLITSILLASRALVAVAARSLAGVREVTLPQFRTLVLLSAHRGLTISQLADELDIHPTTATRLADRLIVRDLAVRRTASHDGRVVELHLTERGRRIVDRVTARRRRDIAAIIGRMPEHERRGATRVFAAFSAAAGETAGADLLGWEPASR